MAHNFAHAAFSRNHATRQTERGCVRRGTLVGVTGPFRKSGPLWRGCWRCLRCPCHGAQLLCGHRWHVPGEAAHGAHAGLPHCSSRDLVPLSAAPGHPLGERRNPGPPSPLASALERSAQVMPVHSQGGKACSREFSGSEASLSFLIVRPQHRMLSFEMMSVGWRWIYGSDVRSSSVRPAGFWTSRLECLPSELFQRQGT